eukprot:scaffold23920_cov199-Amphora_coffeaeformis.AAC.2
MILVAGLLVRVAGRASFVCWPPLERHCLISWLLAFGKSDVAQTFSSLCKESLRTLYYEDTPQRSTKAAV